MNQAYYNHDQLSSGSESKEKINSDSTYMYLYKNHQNLISRHAYGRVGWLFVCCFFFLLPYTPIAKYVSDLK